MNEERELKFEIDDIFDFVVDVKNNSYVALRKVAWFDNEPKIELRKWIAKPEGDVPQKGVTFFSEDGVNLLAEVLVENDFGDTKNILESLSSRKDFEENINALGYNKKE